MGATREPSFAPCLTWGMSMIGLKYVGYGPLGKSNWYHLRASSRDSAQICNEIGHLELELVDINPWLSIRIVIFRGSKVCRQILRRSSCGRFGNRVKLKGFGV